MSFKNRQFSMNRSTGSPRLSTKIQRRFSTHDPNANGELCCFLVVGCCWLLMRGIFQCTTNGEVQNVHLARPKNVADTDNHRELFCDFSFNLRGLRGSPIAVSGVQVLTVPQKPTRRSIVNSAMLMKDTNPMLA